MVLFWKDLCRIFAGNCRVLKGSVLQGIAGSLQGIAGYCRGLVCRVLQGRFARYCRGPRRVVARGLCRELRRVVRRSPGNG